MLNTTIRHTDSVTPLPIALRQKNVLKSGEKAAKMQFFDLLDLFAEISLHLDFQAWQKGFSYQISIAPDVPRFFAGYPLLLQEAVCALTDHVPPCSQKANMIIQVTTKAVAKRWKHNLRVEIFIPGLGICRASFKTDFLRSRLALNNLRLVYGHSSNGEWEGLLAAPLTGLITGQNSLGWGSKYRLEMEVSAVPTSSILSQQDNQNDISEADIPQAKIHPIRP